MALDGTYKVTVDVLKQQLDGEVVVTTEGGVLKGTVSYMGQTLELEDVKETADGITATASAQLPTGKTTVQVSAKVDGDDISGTIKAFPISATFSGTKIA